MKQSVALEKTDKVFSRNVTCTFKCKEQDCKYYLAQACPGCYNQDSSFAMLKSRKGMGGAPALLCIFKGTGPFVAGVGKTPVSPILEGKQKWSEPNKGSCGGKINRSNGVSKELRKARSFGREEMINIPIDVTTTAKPNQLLFTEHGLGLILGS